jgi:hypothetical protein
MTGTEIYKRTPAYEQQAREIRLHAPHWKLLLAYDGQRTLAEVALSAEVSFAEALPLTQKFLDHGWIEEQPARAISPRAVLPSPRPPFCTNRPSRPVRPLRRPHLPLARLRRRLSRLPCPRRELSPRWLRPSRR